MKTHIENRYDLIVAGGGPAGSTAAALSAEAGVKTLLLERSDQPVFKVGESLIPGTYAILKRLGMVEKLNAADFPRKYSVQFFSSSGKASRPFYFFESRPGEQSVTWQVLRADFDEMLLENAAEKGACVVRGARVLNALFDGGRAVGVRAKLPNGEETEIRSKVFMDATGQSALAARRMKICEPDLRLRKAAVYTHFIGAKRDEGIDEGATLILSSRGKDSWFWYIPLPRDHVSVGAVGSIEALFSDRSLSAEQIFERELEKCEPLQERLEGSRQAFPMKTTKDFSYRASQIAGPGWVLIGDAYGFLDPIYSSGVYLALQSGEWAADAAVEAIQTGDLSAERLGAFGAKLYEGMEAFRQLIYVFYMKEFSFSRFLTERPECRMGVADILSGYVYTDEVETALTGLDAFLRSVSADDQV